MIRDAYQDEDSQEKRYAVSSLYCSPGRMSTATFNLACLGYQALPHACVG